MRVERLIEVIVGPFVERGGALEALPHLGKKDDG